MGWRPEVYACAVRPLGCWARTEIARVGGCATSRCLWSASPLNSINSTSSSAHTHGLVCSQKVSMVWVNIAGRYVVTNIGWACRSGTLCRARW
ncbi:hypothetical protein M2272_000885 [Mycobacterium frederiksbergense]|uniref:Uncharacterized protein n=1 Tax=Mycolicibacterium frederiksbergense TaxID=117567 RepID=A0ABT6KU72_9MYCO|nr:hypothetical protein [Mycolicibacterium frederiksbergense]